MEKKFVVFLLLVILPAWSSAQIYKCVAPDGKMTLSDRGCPASTQADTVPVKPTNSMDDPRKKSRAIDRCDSDGCWDQNGRLYDTTHQYTTPTKRDEGAHARR